VTSVDELLGQKSLPKIMQEAEQLVTSVDKLLYHKSVKEWVLDDDEGLFFYPKVRIQIFLCRLIASDLLAWKYS
jgi:hypothetical protein